MWCSLELSVLIDYIQDDLTERIQNITTILMERGIKMKVNRIVKIALLIPHYYFTLLYHSFAYPGRPICSQTAG